MKKTSSKNSILPLGDRVIVTDPTASKPVGEKTDHGESIVGGIIVPSDSSRTIKQLTKDTGSPHFIVTALACGPACKMVQTGQRLVITEQGLFRINVGGVSFCGVVEGNVVAILK
jgi:hypothetical protein